MSSLRFVASHASVISGDAWRHLTSRVRGKAFYKRACKLHCLALLFMLVLLNKQEEEEVVDLFDCLEEDEGVEASAGWALSPSSIQVVSTLRGRMSSSTPLQNDGSRVKN